MDSMCPNGPIVVARAMIAWTSVAYVKIILFSQVFGSPLLLKVLICMSGDGTARCRHIFSYCNCKILAKSGLLRKYQNYLGKAKNLGKLRAHLRDQINMDSLAAMISQCLDQPVPVLANAWISQYLDQPVPGSACSWISQCLDQPLSGSATLGRDTLGPFEAARPLWVHLYTLG